ncbi:MAG: CotH kinase family protein, partial [Planctomycetia bacterium]|nr:CotH kinase family protein [Planctomycetia bacterium]
ATEVPGAVIRYTLDRTVPTFPSSPVYTGPITVSATTMVRASLFVPGYSASAAVSETYFALDPALASFDSNLPLVVVDTFGEILVNTSLEHPFVSSASMTIEPGVDGRAALTDAAAYSGQTGVKCRGWSATIEKRNYPKFNYALETRNEAGGDLAVSLLGLPEESDWVLLGPFSDKTLMRDYLSYKWSSDMGQYAPRTEYFELYVNMDDGTIGVDDYVGVYLLVEKIKVGENRVDIAELDPTDNALPDVSGGYIFAQDRTEYESTFNTPMSGTWVHVSPGKDEITPEQIAYLTSYVTTVENVLASSTFADPVNGYAQYIDVDSFVDSFISIELARNTDGYGLSTYYYKDRDGKLVAGPVWDYNLTMGNAWYGRTWDPTGWKYSQTSQDDYYFYYRMLQDPNFVQAIVDRWTELRRGIFSDERVMQDIDDTAAYLDEAQQRNYEHYDTVPLAYNPAGDTGLYNVLETCIWPNFFVAGTYEGEVDVLRLWLQDRLAWMDAQFLAAPELSQDGGTIDIGAPVTASAAIGTVYYTTDGSDPRLPGGGLSPTAVAMGAQTSENVLIPTGANWQYLDSGKNLGTAWRAAAYDPPDPNPQAPSYFHPVFTPQELWKYGQAQLGYGDGDEATVVSYGPNPNSKYITTYFRHGFGLVKKSAITSLRLRLLCDDGAVVYLNGYEVARYNMPTGTISYTTPASSAIDGDAESQYHELAINVPVVLSRLVDGTNLIAVEVHQRSGTSSDISFDLELIGTGTNIGSSGQVSFLQNTLLTARAYDGTRWSGLTEAAFVVASPLAITEIMYNPPAPTAAEIAA